MRLDRRVLLQSLGLGAAGFCLPSVGRATVAAAPKRILFYVTSHGTVYDRWRMRPGAEPDDVDFEATLGGLGEADFSDILRPLWRHREKLLVLDGLANAPGITGEFQAHEVGTASCLTARKPLPVPGAFANPMGPSIDQAIAALQATPFPSLEYGIGGVEIYPVCFDAVGQPLPYEVDPTAAWARLFPGGPTTLEAARLQARRGSVLDRVADRYEALVARVGSEDRAKLEQHRDLVRDLEARVTSLGLLDCAPIVAPDVSLQPTPYAASFPEFLLDIFFDLAVSALACGQTNVVTVRQDYLPNATVGAPPGDLHTEIAHLGSFDPVAEELMVTYGAFHAERIAELLDRLDAIPDGEGTLLDNTIVVWTNELANGHHEFVDLPTVIAGGADQLSLGRYVRWAPITAIQGYLGVSIVGELHNKLLTSLGQAMGSTMTEFGTPSFAMPDGTPHPSTGALDRIQR